MKTYQLSKQSIKHLITNSWLIILLYYNKHIKDIMLNILSLKI